MSLHAIPTRPLAVAFDVNETLFRLDSLRPRFAALGLPPLALEWWFAVVLRDGFAHELAGEAASFPALAFEALHEVCAAAGVVGDPVAIRRALEGFDELDAHDDVAPALARLGHAGVPALALTNGGPRAVGLLVARAGASAAFAHVISVDEVGRWKPRADPYRFAARRAGVEPGACALVAAHPWDLHGASRAGLVTGWVNRHGRPYPSTFDPPDVEGADLLEVVDKLLALPGA